MAPVEIAWVFRRVLVIVLRIAMAIRLQKVSALECRDTEEMNGRPVDSDNKKVLRIGYLSIGAKKAMYSAPNPFCNLIDVPFLWCRNVRYRDVVNRFVRRLDLSAIGLQNSRSSKSPFRSEREWLRWMRDDDHL